MNLQYILTLALIALTIEIPKGENWTKSKIVVAVDGSLQKFLIKYNEYVIPEIEETSESWKTPITLEFALFKRR